MQWKATGEATWLNELLGYTIRYYTEVYIGNLMNVWTACEVSTKA